jgi:hypothetical protein
MAETVYKIPFDQILNQVLTDYLNLDEPPNDVSKGSMPFIMGSVISSQSWGIRQFINFVANQIVPGPEMATEFLNKWAGYYDIVRTADDTDETLLDKVLNRVRMPPSGGNVNDYTNWALDQNNSFVIDTIADPDVTYYNALVTTVDIAFGAGTVGVFTIPNDESIIFSPAFSSSGANTSVTVSKLVDAGADFITDAVAIGFQVTNTDNNTTAFVTAIDNLTTLSLDTDIFVSTPTNYAIQSFEEQLRAATFDYIETQRPAGLPTPTTVVSAKPSILNINMTVSAGPNYNNTATITAVTNYRDGLKPGESFFQSVAICLALANGATSTTVTAPAAEETTIGNNFFHRGGDVIITIA